LLYLDEAVLGEIDAEEEDLSLLACMVGELLAKVSHHACG
jgi:hypothetical protein